MKDITVDSNNSTHIKDTSYWVLLLKKQKIKVLKYWKPGFFVESLCILCGKYCLSLSISLFSLLSLSLFFLSLYLSLWMISSINMSSWLYLEEQPRHLLISLLMVINRRTTRVTQSLVTTILIYSFVDHRVWWNIIGRRGTVYILIYCLSSLLFTSSAIPTNSAIKMVILLFYFFVQCFYHWCSKPFQNLLLINKIFVSFQPL